METADHPLIQIIIGSTRAGRAGEPVAKWLAELAAARGDLTPELVDLAEMELPWLASSTPPANERREQGAQDWAARIAAADGYVLVTSEYNHGYAAPLKNALDLLFAEWARKPVAFLSYGGASGGVRAVEQLRQVAIELEMVPLRRHVAIPAIFRRLDEERHLIDAPVNEAQAMLDDLVWWASMLADARLASAARDAASAA
jgi:NAD(P)H-dependent FMN reductase